MPNGGAYHVTRQPLSESEMVAWRKLEASISAFELRPPTLGFRVGDRFPLESLSLVPLDLAGNPLPAVVGGMAATGFTIELPQGTRAVRIEGLDLVAHSPGDFALWIQPMLADNQQRIRQLRLSVSVRA
jgi:hypothetical protein